jgi:hypothetical protein
MHRYTTNAKRSKSEQKKGDRVSTIVACRAFILKHFLTAKCSQPQAPPPVTLPPVGRACAPVEDRSTADLRKVFYLKYFDGELML